MANKSTPPIASTAPLTVPEVSMENTPPIRTTPKDTLPKGFKLEVGQVMGDFMSWHGWTSTSESDQSSSTPQTSSQSLSQPGTSEKPRIPTLSKFEKLMFEYLKKQGGPHSQSSTSELPLPSIAKQTL